MQVVIIVLDRRNRRWLRNHSVRQGCDALAAQGSWALQGEWPSVSGWPDFVTWPLLRAAERTADASKALEGVTPIQSRLSLVLDVKIGFNDPSWHTFLKDYSFLINRPVPAFPVLPVISQPCSVGVLRACQSTAPADQSSLASHKFGFRQRELRSASKPNHRHTQNFNVTSQVSLVLHSYCRSCIEGN